MFQRGHRIALGSLNVDVLQKYDFMVINRKAMELMERLFIEQEFGISPMCNFGKASGKENKSVETSRGFRFPVPARGFHTLL